MYQGPSHFGQKDIKFSRRVLTTMDLHNEKPRSTIHQQTLKQTPVFAVKILLCPVCSGESGLERVCMYDPSSLRRCWGLADCD